MSREQGDGFRTWTDEKLNKYYDEVFRPAYLKAVDYHEKVVKVNGGKIVCELENEVESDGFKLNTIQVLGRKFMVRVFSDENSDIADAVEVFTDKAEANERFKFWKAHLMH